MLAFVIGIFLFNNAILSSEDPQNINYYNNSEVSLSATISQIKQKTNSTQLILEPKTLLSQDQNKKKREFSLKNQSM